MMYSKVVWTYWEGTMDYITKQCLESWNKFIPKGWKIILLNSSNIDNYSIIKPLRFNKLSHTTKSDVIRLSVLYNYGGLWMDASVLLLESLDWIYEYEKNSYYGFILKHKSYLESWFIFVPNIYNINIRMWLNVFNDILDTQPYNRHLAYTNKCTTDDDYFMIYQSFCYLVENDNQFRNTFSKIDEDAIQYFYRPFAPINSYNKLVKFAKVGRKAYKYCRFPLIYVYLVVLFIIIFLIFGRKNN